MYSPNSIRPTIAKNPFFKPKLDSLRRPYLGATGEFDLIFFFRDLWSWPDAIELESAPAEPPLRRNFCRQMTHLLIQPNSIAFGSAPRREADSQPISQLGRQAVSQTENTVWFFVSGEDQCPQGKQWPNGNAADRRLFGRRFEPWSGEDGGGSQPATIRTADIKLGSRLRYHSTGV